VHLEATEANHLLVANHLQTLGTFIVAATARATKATLCKCYTAQQHPFCLSMYPAPGRHSPFLLNVRDHLLAIRIGIHDWRNIARFLAPPTRGN
ncbi:hypothetical protein, partial [Saccharospirillum sp.]|uniref:hypothetical protein n=1 Tax=Saccharospirillum sp. TaxID=2033801 RepID=UPI0034A04881